MSRVTPLAAVYKHGVTQAPGCLAQISNGWGGLNCRETFVIDPAIAPGLAGILLMVNHNVKFHDIAFFDIMIIRDAAWGSQRPE